MRRPLKVISLLFLSIFIGLFLYWAKCQYQIDIFKTIQWERYLPLDFLQRKEPVIDAGKVGVLINEDFESGSLSNWSKLWSRAKVGSVEIKKSGVNNSNCVSINSPVSADWSFQRQELIRVSPGQHFEYRVSYKGDALSNISIIMYNTQNVLTDWFYAKTDLPVTSTWKNVGRSFVIPSGTAYMRFRITGSNKGFVLLDNILFKKGLVL